MTKPETQLTLHHELSEILLQLQFSYAYADNSEPYLTNQRKLARTQILDLFSSHIEALRDEMEKKKQTIIRGAGSADTSYVMGYNQAISECQRLLEGLK